MITLLDRPPIGPKKFRLHELFRYIVSTLVLVKFREGKNMVHHVFANFTRLKKLNSQHVYVSIPYILYLCLSTKCVRQRLDFLVYDECNKMFTI